MVDRSKSLDGGARLTVVTVGELDRVEHRHVVVVLEHRVVVVELPPRRALPHESVLADDRDSSPDGGQLDRPPPLVVRRPTGWFISSDHEDLSVEVLGTQQVRPAQPDADASAEATMIRAMGEGVAQRRPAPG
jgi:hypothetical protein